MFINYRVLVLVNCCVIKEKPFRTCCYRKIINFRVLTLGFIASSHPFAFPLTAFPAVFFLLYWKSSYSSFTHLVSLCFVHRTPFFYIEVIRLFSLQESLSSESFCLDSQYQISHWAKTITVPLTFLHEKLSSTFRRSFCFRSNHVLRPGGWNYTRKRSPEDTAILAQYFSVNRLAQRWASRELYICYWENLTAHSDAEVWYRAMWNGNTGNAINIAGIQL